MSPLRHVARGIVGEQTAVHEARQESPARGGLHRSDGRPVDPGGRVEDDAPGRRRREYAVEHHTVKMQVRIERRPEAVDEGHRPEARRGTRARTVRPQALLHRAQEQAQRRTLEVGVAVQEVTQSLRYHQHPLAHRQARDDVIGEMRRRLDQRRRVLDSGAGPDNQARCPLGGALNVPR